jgi:hypothetical protein
LKLPLVKFSRPGVSPFVGPPKEMAGQWRRRRLTVARVQADLWVEFETFVGAWFLI